MSPAGLLILAVSLTLAASIAERIWIRHQRQRLRDLATEWQMNYSPADQFRLTPRVFVNFPVPGAGKIRIVDLIYGIDQDVYRYIFTVEYTLGVVSGKRRIRRGGSLSEPRDRASDAAPANVTLAPAHLPIMEQYRRLRPTEQVQQTGTAGDAEDSDRFK